MIWLCMKAADQNGERIAKVLARAGVASRRGAERLIKEGRVKIDGQLLEGPAHNVTPGNIIEVDGKTINKPAPTALWLYHKPPGLIVSHDDPQGRPTVFRSLPDSMPRVSSVGRLDIASEGLLLLTNNGALAGFLEHPSTGWARHYRVRAYGVPDEEKLDRMREGVTVDGVRYAPTEIILERGKGKNSWFNMTLQEGKNREVRVLLAYAGVQVNRLIRLSYGPFHLGKLAAGAVVPVETDILRQHLGNDATNFSL